MATMMLVDDESIIRKGIRYYINWGLHGINIVGEASNGEEGLRQAIAKKPDIIITDIRMPLMDGLTMSRKIKEVLPNTKILLLSGYDDKEYFLGAIENKIDKYIFKESSADNIVDAVLKLKKEIVSQNSQKEREQEKKELVDNNYTVLYQHLMQDFFNGKMSIDEFDHQAKLLELLYSKGRYTPIDLMSDRFLDAKKVGRISFGLTGFIYLAAVEDRKHLRVLVQCDDVLAFITKLSTLLDTCFISITGDEIEIEDAPDFFARAKVFESSLNWYTLDAIIRLDYLEKNKSMKHVELLEMETNILESYYSSAPNYKELLNNHYEISKERLLPLDIYKDSVKRIITPILRNKNQMEDLEFTLNLIDAASNPPEIKSILETKAVIEQQQCSSPVILNVIKHIENNYSSTLSLNDLAEVGGVSSSYLSKLFKEQTGLNVVEYIRKCRINIAKKLLEETDDRVNEIAEKIGYPNYKRFSSCFLQETGTNPRAYRKNLKKNK
ncbi:MAG: response regulator transcription factor [Sphaerochaeta sp.]